MLSGLDTYAKLLWDEIKLVSLVMGNSWGLKQRDSTFGGKPECKQVKWGMRRGVDVKADVRMCELNVLWCV